MSNSVSVSVGVVVERRKIDNPWQDHVWRPVSIIPGAPDGPQWKELVRGDGWVQYLAGTVPLELNRTDTIGYKHNLEGERPSLYVVLRRASDSDPPVEVLLVTASPYEADAYSESGEERIEPVDMPAVLIPWVADYVENNHVEEPFRKRQRDKVKLEEHKFGQEPVFVTRRNRRQRSDG